MLDQRVHTLASTQELSYSTRNFVKLAGDYLGEEIPLYLSMGTWPRHIDCFERQYDKAFAKGPIFGADFMDRVQKRVQVFIHSCNTTYIEDMESGALAEFGGLQKEGGERRVVDDEAGMGELAHTKGGGATKNRWTWERSQVERWGSWMRHSSQHRSRSAAVDHG